MNHRKERQTHDVIKASVVTALYIVLTFLLAPLSFGIGLRISEGLNFLVLYNRRHIIGLVIGVFLVNYFSYGVIDMIVGSISTLVFLLLGESIADLFVEKLGLKYFFSCDPMILKYIILTIIFSLSMFTIALMVKWLGATEAFWPLYIKMAFIEALSMLIGGFIIYPMSRRIDLT